MSSPSPPLDEGTPLSAPTISREKMRLFAPIRDTVPAPGAGPVFGCHFFRLLRENTGGYFLLLFTGIGVGLFLLGLANILDQGEGEESLLSRVMPMLIGTIFILGSLQMLASLLAPTINPERVGPAAEPWTWDHPWRKEWMARDYAGGKDPLESIDFAFEVPYDQPGTNLPAEKPTYWQIVASVPLTGPDLETVFLAPVYQHAPRR